MRTIFLWRPYFPTPFSIYALLNMRRHLRTTVGRNWKEPWRTNKQTITIAAAAVFFHVLRVALDGDSEAESRHLPRVRCIRFFWQPSPDLVPYPLPRAFDFGLLTFGQLAILVLLAFPSLTGFFVSSLLSFFFTVGLWENKKQTLTFCVVHTSGTSIRRCINV